MQQDYQWCWAAGEWDRPKRRTESEDIEARSVNDECDDIRVPILLGESGPPLLKGPLLIRPEYSLHFTVSVTQAHNITLSVTVAHRYLVRRNKVCALAIAMSDPNPMKYIGLTKVQWKTMRSKTLTILPLISAF